MPDESGNYNILTGLKRELNYISVSIGGFFLLLAIVALIRFLGNRLLPVVMPAYRWRTIAVGWVGGLTGSLVDNALWQFGPQIVEINLLAAFIGATLFVLALGLFPFIKILFGKTD